jgi:hypothetical protein
LTALVEVIFARLAALVEVILRDWRHWWKSFCVIGGTGGSHFLHDWQHWWKPFCVIGGTGGSHCA